MATQNTEFGSLVRSLIDEVVFEIPDRGYIIRASYLKEKMSGEALIEIFYKDTLIREFLFPAYKVWNIAAHFNDIIDSEIEKNEAGYHMASWDGISPV